MSNLRLILLAGATALLASPAIAGPLTEAHVTKIINKVQVVDPAKGAHAAALQETIKDEIELKTGVKSRSELLFQDNTLTRIGPETSFSFKAGTRDMSLEHGTMLLQVPKGLGGAKIRTAAVTAAITGTTIMMEYTPGKHIKVLVLEGSLRLSTNGRFGDSVVLRPGRMIMMRPDSKRIPPPVSVDLKRIVRTSSLVNMSKKNGAQLPSADLIDKEIAQQTHEKANADLIETDLVIHGAGTTAINSVGTVVDVLARNEQGRSLTPAATTSAPGATPAPTPSTTSDGTAGTDPNASASPAPTPIAGATPAPTPVLAVTPAPTPNPSSDDEKDKGGHNGNGNGDNGKGGGKDKGDHNGDGNPDDGKGSDKEKGKGHGGHPMNLPQPKAEPARVSARQTFSPTLNLSRNEH
jgi:hypothetical protein